jgi:hypothetical protein
VCVYYHNLALWIDQWIANDPDPKWGNKQSVIIVFTTLKTSQRLGHDVPDEHTIAQRIQGTRPSMLCDFCLVEGK